MTASFASDVFASNLSNDFQQVADKKMYASIKMGGTVVYGAEVSLPPQIENANSMDVRRAVLGCLVKEIEATSDGMKRGYLCKVIDSVNRAEAHTVKFSLAVKDKKKAPSLRVVAQPSAAYDDGVIYSDIEETTGAAARSLMSNAHF